jgi:hypothetical protein
MNKNSETGPRFRAQIISIEFGLTMPTRKTRRRRPAGSTSALLLPNPAEYALNLVVIFAAAV